MKYELISFKFSEDKNINADEYYVDTNIYIHPTDGIADDFMRQIKIVSNNSQTGTEVDNERIAAVNAYITLINK